MFTIREELQNLIDNIIQQETGITGIFLFNPDNALVLLVSQVQVGVKIDFEFLANWLTRLNLPVLNKVGLGEIQYGTFKLSEAVVYLHFFEPASQEPLILSFICTDAMAFEIIQQRYLPIITGKLSEVFGTKRP